MGFLTRSCYTLVLVAASAWAGEPICWVELTDKLGLGEECFLLSFDNGVYQVSTLDGQQLSIPETELRSIRFAPLPEVPERPPQGLEGPPIRSEAPKVGSMLRDLQAKRDENLRKLRELKEKGKLDAHIAELEAQLRKVKSVIGAQVIFIQLIPAYRVAGKPIGLPEIEGLIDSIEDPAVRATMTRPEVLRRLRSQLLPSGQFRRGGRPD